MNVVTSPVEALVEALHDVWEHPVLFATDVVDNAYTPGAWDDIATALVQALDAQGFAIVRHRPQLADETAERIAMAGLSGRLGKDMQTYLEEFAIPAVLPPAPDDGRPR